MTMSVTKEHSNLIAVALEPETCKSLALLEFSHTNHNSKTLESLGPP